MKNNKNILTVIPARRNSKRLPRKNILSLNGKPLVSWTIETAIETSLTNRIIVSSDDEEVIKIVNNYNDPRIFFHKRSKILAGDKISTSAVLLDIIKSQTSMNYYPDTIILLQPTSPLRNSNDISKALKIFLDSNSKNTVVSVTPLEHPSSWIGNVTGSGRFLMNEFVEKRSQDHKIEYRLNGAIYVIDTKCLIKTKSLFSQNLEAYIMPRERSYDIDNLDDFKVVSALVGKV